MGIIEHHKNITVCSVILQSAASAILVGQIQMNFPLEMTD